MAKSPPSFDFFPGDWLGDTRTISLAAAGAYINLLAYQWKYGHIPETIEKQAHLNGVDARIWGSVWDELKAEGYFVVIEAAELVDWNDKDINKNVHVNAKLHEMRQEKLPLWRHRREVNTNNRRGKRATKKEITNRKRIVNENTSIREVGSRKKEVKKRIVIALPYESAPYREAWDGYLEVRRVKGHTMTARALGLVVAKLRGMDEAGGIAALDAATVGGWKSVYAPSQSSELAEKESATRRRQKRLADTAREAKEAAARVASRRLEA